MAGASDDSLQQMAHLVVEATGAERVIVWLRLGELLATQAVGRQAARLPGRSRSTAAAWNRRWRRGSLAVRHFRSNMRRSCWAR